MNISPKAVRFDDDCLWVDLEDGRTIGAPLAWFPRLFHATKEQLQACELSARGLHWEDLDGRLRRGSAGWTGRHDTAGQRGGMTRL